MKKTWTIIGVILGFIGAAVIFLFAEDAYKKRKYKKSLEKDTTDVGNDWGDLFPEDAENTGNDWGEVPEGEKKVSEENFVQ